MPRGRPKGHRLSAESKARISDSLAGQVKTAEHRERIAAGQAATWERRLEERVVTLRRMAKEAPTADARRYLEREAAKVARRAAR